VEPRRGAGIRPPLALPGLIAGAAVLATPLTAAAALPHHRLDVRLLPGDQGLRATDGIRWRGSGPLRLALRPDLTVPGARVDGRPYDLTPAGRGRWQGRRALEAGRHRVSFRYHGRLAAGGDHGRDARSAGPGFPPPIAASGTYLPAGSGWVPRLGAGRITYRLQVTGPGSQHYAAAGARAPEPPGDGRRSVVYRRRHPIPGITLLGAPCGACSAELGERWRALGSGPSLARRPSQADARQARGADTARRRHGPAGGRR